MNIFFVTANNPNTERKIPIRLQTKLVLFCMLPKNPPLSSHLQNKKGFRLKLWLDISLSMLGLTAVSNKIYEKLLYKISFTKPALTFPGGRGDKNNKTRLHKVTRILFQIRTHLNNSILQCWFYETSIGILASN